MVKPAPKPTKPQPRSLGPVASLENYVQPDWWNRIFNAMYLKTDGDVVEDADITRTEVDLFSEVLGVEKGDRILDLCCGQGRHSLEWAGRGFDVTGLDRSRFLIQKARQRARNLGVNGIFKEGDVRKLPFGPDHFDHCCILGNSFGYFESLDEDLVVLKEARRVLKPGGRILLDVTDGEHLRKEYQPRSWEWINQQLFVCRERALSKDEQKLISREVITDIKKGVVADQFYSERLYTAQELMTLLENAGFSEIKTIGQLSPDSLRNQDLGMMSRRHVITAVLKKSPSRAKTKPVAEKTKVTVLLGDPRKTDIIKPNGLFDEDDHYTLNQLKTALQSLEGFKFEYLDDHQSLLTDLAKRKQKTDLIFNLCDEGYNNQARAELHIPAILEMFELPYTGAAPQALAFCYDKSLVRGMARELGIAVPQAFLVRAEDNVFGLPISFPVLIKPNLGDSSFGITQDNLVYNMEDLMEGISRVRGRMGFDQPFLIEEFLPGKDISFGVIGNPETEYLLLPLIEEDYSQLPEGLPRICGYEAKWLPDSPYSKVGSIPVQLPPMTEKEIIDSSLTLFSRLGCRDYSRFDWRLDAKGKPKLLEVNPNPGWCWDGHLAKMAHLANYNYPQMLELIIKAGQARLRRQEH